jgi:hypothetical protein
MQTWCCGVKAAVIGDGLARQRLGEGLLIGGDVNQPAPGQLFPQRGEGGVVALLAHDTIIWPGHGPQAISATPPRPVETSWGVLGIAKSN